MATQGISVAAAARQLGVSKKAVYRMVDDGTLRFKRGPKKGSVITLHVGDVAAQAEAEWQRNVPSPNTSGCPCDACRKAGGHSSDCAIIKASTWTLGHDLAKVAP